MLIQKWTHMFDGPHIGEPDDSCSVCKSQLVSQIAAASIGTPCSGPGLQSQARGLEGLISQSLSSFERTEVASQSQRRQEFVIKHDHTPKPGWPCPGCHGMGNMGDGAMSISYEETRYTPPTSCSLCNGKGRVLVTAIPD
jgi:hypothetical protein